MTTMTNDMKHLEKAAIEKYEDLLDTVLVLEAMKAQRGPGEKWKDIKKKRTQNV
ncbi:MAG: hypothetical protein ABIH39_05240 [Candidatus Margulisiibacteriota bacterium]